MSINEKTKYRISNKWNDQTKKFDQDQFDFEDKGNFAVGRMSWSIKEKDKQGEVAFVNSSIKFICFGASKDLIGSNLSAKFNIDANLCNKSFTNDEGKKIAFWQLTIFQVEIAEQGEYKEPAKASEAVEEDDFDNIIPF